MYSSYFGSQAIQAYISVVGMVSQSMAVVSDATRINGQS